VSDNSVVVCEEKVRFFLLLFRTICHKVGLAIVTVGPSDMDEQLVQLFLGPNKQFWGGLTVGPLWGTFVTKRPKVLETQCPWSETCGLNCHKDQRPGDYTSMHRIFSLNSPHLYSQFDIIPAQEKDIVCTIV
jgi:hypothetical protein